MCCVDIEGLSKHFGGLAALSDISFHLDEGEILALIGPNGAGKTTLFNVVTGFLSSNGGTISFLGKEITGRHPHEIARMGMIRTFQLNMLFMSLSVIENILLGFHLHTSVPYLSLNPQNARLSMKQDREKAQEIMDFLGLSEVQNFRAGTLPHGQQRILGIAIALAANPKVLLLDEPATGLSEKERSSLIKKIRQLRDRGISIMLVEHNMRLVMDISERIVVLDFGRKIAEGSPQEVVKNPDVIKAYLGHKYGNP
jgi:branched-chain amino acid transport system ATP-binding protein